MTNPTTPGIAELLDAFDAYARDNIGNCSDRHCMLGGNAVGTNGGCKCWDDRRKARWYMMATHQLHKNIRAAIEAQRDEALKDAEVYRAMMDACEKLPKWWNITFEVEHHSGWINLTDPEGNAIGVDTFGSSDSTLAEQVGEALAFALEHDTSDAAIAQRGGEGEP